MISAQPRRRERARQRRRAGAPDGPHRRCRAALEARARRSIRHRAAPCICISPNRWTNAGASLTRLPALPRLPRAGVPPNRGQASGSVPISSSAVDPAGSAMRSPAAGTRAEAPTQFELAATDRATDRGCEISQQQAQQRLDESRQIDVRIGIQAWGSEGDIRPLIALGHGLVERGHDVELVYTDIADRRLRSGRIGARHAGAARSRRRWCRTSTRRTGSASRSSTRAIR